MILLRLISWQYARKHRTRTLLTVAGIALGVAVFVGMHTANQSVLYAFHSTVDRIAGKTQLQVWAGESGFEEAVLERVQATPQVRAAVPVIEAVVATGEAGQGNLLILGVDLTGDRSLRDYDLESGEEEIIEDPLVFLAQPDSLIVTREFATRNGLETGSRIPLSTMEGTKEFTVRGVMRSGGLTSAFGGNLAIMDIYAAQKIFGRGRHFDRIDLALRDDVPLAAGQGALRRLLGPGFQVEPPSGRVAQFDSILRVYSLTLNVSSVFALVIGMFIIYNSFAIAVTQRRTEIGILRALGASRGQIRWLFLGESVALGLAGTLLGIGFGIGLARGAVGQVGGLLEGIYGLTQRAEEVALNPRLLALAFLIGVVTSMISAWIPARHAARVDPVKALQKGKYQVLSAGENRIRRLLAGAMAVIAVLCLALSRSPLWFYTGYLLTILTALLLTPTLTLWLSRTLRPALKGMLPVEGVLAADSLIQSPRRTSATVAALMLSLAMVVGLGGVARASYRPIVDWMTAALNPDMFVTATENLSDRTYRFPASMREEIERIPGVEHVQSVRSARMIFRGGPVLVVAVEIDRVGRKVRNRIIAGDRDTMYDVAARGDGILISENLAELQRLSLGETLELATPSGPLRLPIVGITRDFSDQQGSVLLDRKVYQRWWRDDTLNLFRIYLHPGASPQETKERILERFRHERRLFVLMNHEVRRHILRLTDQWFGLTYVQIAVAVLVAVLGIANTLTVSITDRRREIGVVQAVGGLRNQVRFTVWIEAVSIGAIGIFLGLALGAVNLYYTLQMTRLHFSGMRFDYEYPLGLASLLAPFILGAALVSSLWPAESAVRASLVEALEYE
jgi:putative ABC transport system permease protein